MSTLPILKRKYPWYIFITYVSNTIKVLNKSFTVKYYVFFVSNSHNAFFPIIFYRFVRGLSLKLAIVSISLLVMPIPETHFPRITLPRLWRSRAPVPSRALYPGFTVLISNDCFPTLLDNRVCGGSKAQCFLSFLFLNLFKREYVFVFGLDDEKIDAFGFSLTVFRSKPFLWLKHRYGAKLNFSKRSPKLAFGLFAGRLVHRNIW